ncbi:MAG: hypothetical protein ACK501_16050 [Planctomycetota bacterium]|jgi:hypothetical protein
MRPSTRSRLRRLAVGCLLLALGGCTFIADEFTWIDRAAPGATVQGDRPTDASLGRP